MKKILFALVFTFTIVGVNAQIYSKRGYKTGVDTVITNYELSKLHGMNGNIRDTLNERWTKAQADARFNKVSDNVNAYSLFYSKSQVDSILNVKLFTGITDSLFVGYKFDNNLTDVLGIRTAVNSEAVYSANGKFNGCYQFDTNTDNIHFSMASPPSNERRTYSFWFYLSNKASTDARDQILLGEMTSAYSVKIDVRITYTNDFISATYKNSAGTSFSLIGNTIVTSGVWHYLVFEQPTTSTTMKCYLDGVSQGTPIVMTGTHYTSDNYVTIGNLQAATKAIDGFIDDFYMWNRFLSISEIELVFKNYIGRTYDFNPFN